MKSQNLTRRMILKILFAASVALAFFPWLRSKLSTAMIDEGKAFSDGKPAESGIPLGADEDGLSRVYVARNGTPEQNVRKVIEMMGGIEAFIEPNDIVVLKPNAQWWNQGMTNTDAMKGFIDMVLAIPGFSGEIIVADNHQYQEDNSRGWTTAFPNGSYNLNQLVEFYQEKGFKNITKYHWHCAGPNRGLVQGNAHGDSVVEGPHQGDGYAWRRDMVYQASSGRKTMMTYPIFTSHYSGITIDFKNGPYEDGKYLSRKLKLINFPSLNNHSSWGGVTSCIKNYLGVVDMSCGYHGDTPKGLFNFHYVGHSELNVKYPIFQKIKRRIGIGYFDHFHGGPVGYFMKNIRMADLNIITADRVGYGSRTDQLLSTRPQAVLASRDPVALDYCASKYVLLPETPKDARYHWGEFIAPINDPDNKNGPLWMYLNECNQEGIGNLSESRIRIQEFNYQL